MARLLSVNAGKPREIAWRENGLHVCVDGTGARRAWSDGSISAATHRVIWTVTVGSTALP